MFNFIKGIKKQYALGSLMMLGLSSFAIYYSFKFFESENLEQWIKNLEQKTEAWIKKIKNQMKNYSSSENLKHLWFLYIYLRKIENYISKGSNLDYWKEEKTKYENKIQELKQKITKENLNNKESGEVYEEMNENSLLIIEIDKKMKQLEQQNKELVEKIKGAEKSNEIFEELNFLTWEISQDNEEILRENWEDSFKNTENLKKEITEKQKKIEEKFKSEDLKDFKNEVTILLDLNAKKGRLLNLWNILYSIYDLESKPIRI